jgi:hypothetical protein
VKKPKEQTQAQIAFRAEIWKDFVQNYQRVFIIESQERFSEYCAEFRARWIAGK